MSGRASIVIEKDAHGYYAYCPELPGCQTQAGSVDQAVDRMREAIELYWETLSEEEKRVLVSQEILTTTIEVRVA
ncbi:MAG TPA: type II toxin-antitoxin system HicB family antitoxin [Vicinamibacterales bacterium]|jgi:predicted RNase H-like HicB family nuclease